MTSSVCKSAIIAHGGCITFLPKQPSNQISDMPVLQSYSAMCVAAWSYITAAACMGLTAGLFVRRSEWELPRALIGPLIYWIIVCSVVGYYVVTLATQHLPASQVQSLTSCQSIC